MRSEKLQNAIGGIDPELIARSERPAAVKKRFPWAATVAAVLACALGIGIFFGDGAPYSAELLAEDLVAEYPVMEQYPKYEGMTSPPEQYEAWKRDQKVRESYFQKGRLPDGFISATASEFLSGTEENLIYSPLNVYLALAMLAEMTAGDTRSQILDLIDAYNVRTLRKRANALWNANYNDDGVSRSILAASLWLNKEYDFLREPIEILREYYLTSVYQGEMGSAEFNEALKAWLNDQTDGLLGDQIDTIALSPATVLAFATTVCFRAQWEVGFMQARTENGIFHGAAGDTVVQMMHKKEDGTYYWGERFSAVAKVLDGSGSMWFILPDEGVSLDELLHDEEVLSFICANGDWKQKREAEINLSVPKFQISSQLDLRESLEKLGVTDCFGAEADFSPVLAEKRQACLGEFGHSVKLEVHEDGVTAECYASGQIYGGDTDRAFIVDFTVDRPFLFAVTGEDGSLMFIGTVHTVG